MMINLDNTLFNLKQEYIDCIGPNLRRIYTDSLESIDVVEKGKKILVKAQFNDNYVADVLLGHNIDSILDGLKYHFKVLGYELEIIVLERSLEV